MGASASAQLGNYTEEERVRLSNFSACLEGYPIKEKERLMNLCLKVALTPENTPTPPSKSSFSTMVDDSRSEKYAPLEEEEVTEIITAAAESACSPPPELPKTTTTTTTTNTTSLTPPPRSFTHTPGEQTPNASFRRLPSNTLTATLSPVTSAEAGTVASQTAIGQLLQNSETVVEYETLDEHSKADFRRRRLSYAPLKDIRVRPPSLCSPVFKGMLLSREIDEEDATELATFLRKAVGSFSCHGIEPAYNNKEGHHIASKINQDKGFTTYPYHSNPRYALLGVYDGHGEFGDKVSKFALNEIECNLELHPTFETDVAKAFEEVIVAVDEELKDAAFSVMYSGTTAVVVLIKDNELTMANVGDSRAVIGRKSIGGDGTKNVTEAYDLTVDQNPNSPGEMERIVKAGGYVTEPEEEGYAARVWLDKECSEVGLAMSRSIGDHSVKDIGVIATPVITSHTLEERDDFIILASDGVWEFLSSQQAVDIVSDIIYTEGVSAACENLIEAAGECWQKEEGDYRDDITVVIGKLCELKKCFELSSADLLSLRE